MNMMSDFQQFGSTAVFCDDTHMIARDNKNYKLLALCVCFYFNST